jgi:hypothetical protein
MQVWLLIFSSWLEWRQCDGRVLTILPSVYRKPPPDSSSNGTSHLLLSLLARVSLAATLDIDFRHRMDTPEEETGTPEKEIG